ncbi:MAG: CHAP domain-containing protein [Candidatus Nomurabacteria bacterium]|jgi:hypothetical protein|nr:CHAP domain-containing protein [Candidatus Nomurabacteria bacterium]
MTIRAKIGGAALAVIVIVAAGGLTIGLLQKLRPAGTTTSQNVKTSRAAKTFPQISSNLSAARQKILQTAKAEWQAQPTPTKYSDGADEPWCADFVSWVLSRSGLRMSNPNSGSWRIPGVATLTDYFQSQVGVWQNINSGYTPQPGDVITYYGGAVGQHAEIITSVDGQNFTTVSGGLAKSVSLQEREIRDDKFGVQGFADVDALAADLAEK